jgi:hypothetical protein
MHPIWLRLEHEDADALVKLAIAESRRPEQQAGFLLKLAVQEALARLENGQPATDAVQQMRRQERDLARMKRVYVWLEEEDSEALGRLAIAEYRHPCREAEILLTLAIREAVANAGGKD